MGRTVARQGGCCSFNPEIDTVESENSLIIELQLNVFDHKSKRIIYRTSFKYNELTLVGHPMRIFLHREYIYIDDFYFDDTHKKYIVFTRHLFQLSTRSTP